jgi:hypothetical protein
MTKSSLPAREKWRAFLAGQDVGPMVSPLCDNWSLDVPYRWPYDEPEPFPAGHPSHTLCEQMAMAKVCGWDATFLGSVGFPPRNAALQAQTRTENIDGGTRNEYRTPTPYGDLVRIVERKKTQHVVKQELATEEDYRRKTWVLQGELDCEEDAAIAQGRRLVQAVGDRGVLGTWFGPPYGLLNHDEMFYHMADWPDACLEMMAACRALHVKHLHRLRKAGFDYLFYIVEATEWLSPDFFERHVLPDTLEQTRLWRELGGFVLWHTCGKGKALVERGFYNQCLPEIFETCSEPPVGNLPSLKWARERLDRRIATKGNVPLNLLLEGTPEQVRAEVRRIRRETAGYRHIVGLTDDILANTPLANALAFVEEARR